MGSRGGGVVRGRGEIDPKEGGCYSIRLAQGGGENQPGTAGCEENHSKEAG